MFEVVPDMSASPAENHGNATPTSTGCRSVQ